MVKLRDDHPTLADGRIDIEAAVAGLCALDAGLDAERLLDACRSLRALPKVGESLLSVGLAYAVLVAELELDCESVLAGLLYRAVQGRHATLAQVRAQHGAEVARLIEEVQRMARVSALELDNSPLLERERRDQLENVRRMLVALIHDARVAVLKIAERIVALRLARRVAPARQRRIAREALSVFAPLANRLGIWRLKWELEDLAFRYSEPEEYRRVATRLDGRRTEREQDVAGMMAVLREALAAEGVHAKVEGRAKHIYSIWRKMRAKRVDISQVYDMRAVRVLVPAVRDCYTALGIIHTRWRHVPSEFDDYIANPKENGYRSIHTAVIGPDGKTLEVQIRTEEMHREAELGVCAHWAYKETAVGAGGGYERKLGWLRQVLEWHEELGGFAPFGEELNGALAQERIYVLTPAGHVLDLTAGATPVDFAYRVHTEIGHRCRGALVDGRHVALNTPLATGQRVEIVTGERAEPLREWLDLGRGFVRTSRARAKIHAWFKALEGEQNVHAGLEMLRREIERLGLRADLREIASAMGFTDERALAHALSLGERSIVDVVVTIEATANGAARSHADGAGAPGVSASDLAASTDDRSVERTLGGADPDMAASSRRSLPLHRLTITGHDRLGLLHDVTALLSELGLSIVSTTGSSDRARGTARIDLDVEAEHLADVARVIDRIRRIPGTIDVRRRDVPG